MGPLASSPVTDGGAFLERSKSALRVSPQRCWRRVSLSWMVDGQTACRDDKPGSDASGAALSLKCSKPGLYSANQIALPSPCWLALSHPARQPAESRRSMTSRCHPECDSERVKWWAVTGSNRRPYRCKRYALPTELTAQNLSGVRVIPRRRRRQGRCAACVPAGTRMPPAASSIRTSVLAVRNFRLRIRASATACTASQNRTSGHRADFMPDSVDQLDPSAACRRGSAAAWTA